MKKILLVAFVMVASIGVNAQAQKYLNFGGVGTGLYVSYEIPVHPLISVAPAYFTNWDFNKHVIAAKGNFYFDNLFTLTPDWDVYAGANVGWRIETGDNNNSGANFGIHVGGRWFWSEKWGLNAEFGGGSGVNGGIGVTMKM